jgi:hypothetical protein
MNTTFLPHLVSEQGINHPVLRRLRLGLESGRGDRYAVGDGPKLEPILCAAGGEKEDGSKPKERKKKRKIDGGRRPTGNGFLSMSCRALPGDARAGGSRCG